MIQGLHTGLSGLQANQRALDVTSNNIANQNTEGFSKRVVNFTTNPIKDTPNASAEIKMGTGTHIQSVTRTEDTFLYNQLNDAKKHFAENNEQLKALELVDELVQQDSFTNLYDGFFESIHRYAESPHNMNMQYLAEQSAEKLQERSEEIQEIINKSRERNTRLKNEMQEALPELKTQVDYLDLEIKKAEAMNDFNTDKTFANSLRDRKDLLQTELEVKEASIKSYEKSNETLVSVQNMFKDKFDNTYSNIETYLASNQTGEDANKIIEQEEQIRNDWNEPFVQLKNLKTTMGTILGSSENIMNSLQNKDDNISKVNVSSELINMMVYEKSYQANAKVIQTMDEILQTTINLKQ